MGYISFAPSLISRTTKKLKGNVRGEPPARRKEIIDVSTKNERNYKEYAGKIMADVAWTEEA